MHFCSPGNQESQISKSRSLCAMEQELPSTPPKNILYKLFSSERFVAKLYVKAISLIVKTQSSGATKEMSSFKNININFETIEGCVYVAED